MKPCDFSYAALHECLFLPSLLFQFSLFCFLFPSQLVTSAQSVFSACLPPQLTPFFFPCFSSVLLSHFFSCNSVSLLYCYSGKMLTTGIRANDISVPRVQCIKDTILVGVSFRINYSYLSGLEPFWALFDRELTLRRVNFLALVWDELWTRACPSDKHAWEKGHNMCLSTWSCLS